jgi:DNA-directed RNA polymerase II subunit RPB1
LTTVDKGDKEIKTEYTLSENEIKSVVKSTKESLDVVRRLNDRYYKDIIKFRDLMRITQRLLNLNYKTLLTEFYFPVNLPRIIDDERLSIRNNDKNETLSLEYIFDRIEYILLPNITQIITFNETQLKDKKSIKLKDEKRSKEVFKYYMYEYLCPKKLIFEYKFTKYKFDKIVDLIINDFKKSQVEAGEMVGCLAAQHIGEPFHQLQLVTF